MEMIKYVTNTVEPSIKIKYNDIFINSGINFYIQSDPQKSKKIISGQYSDLYGSKIKAIPESFSIWDTIRIIGKIKSRMTRNTICFFTKKKFHAF